MDLSIQTVLLNVRDLEKSVEFYRGVFDFPVVSERDQVAALLVNEHDRRQVVMLREVEPSALHAGRGTIGPRLLAFEVRSPNELAMIEGRLDQHHAILRRVEGETYKAIFAADPDRIEISVASSLTGAPISTEDWQTIDGAVFAIG